MKHIFLIVEYGFRKRRPLLIGGVFACFWGSFLYSWPSLGKERYLLAIGNRLGHASQEPLRYATRDAQQFSEVMTSLGGIKPSHLTLLQNGSPEDVHQALRRLRDKVSKDDEALFVYYSGHGYAEGLHLGRQTLSLSQLKNWLSEVKIGMKVIIIDACRGGGMQKGWKLIPLSKDFSYGNKKRLCSVLCPILLEF